MPGRLFTSESVTEGHPDKIADRISDTVLDYLMANDENPEDLRVAVETLLTTGLVVVAGEVRTTAYAPVADLVRAAVLDIGYDSSEKGFDGRSTVLDLARAKLARKGCDLLVVNDVSGGRVFGSPDNEAVVLDAAGGSTQVPHGSKSALAHVVWDRVAALLDDDRRSTRAD